MSHETHRGEERSIIIRCSNDFVNDFLNFLIKGVRVNNAGDEGVFIAGTRSHLKASDDGFSWLKKI